MVGNVVVKVIHIKMHLKLKVTVILSNKRRNLFFGFLELDVIKPKVIIAENVGGLTMGEVNNILIRYKIHLKILDMMYVQRF